MVKIFVSILTCHDNMKMPWKKTTNNDHNLVDNDLPSDSGLLNDNDHHNDRMDNT